MRHQDHLVAVHIKAVWLALRFHCKLSFTIKNQLSEILAATDSTYPLIRGQATVNDILTFRLPLSQSHFKLSVIMSSANGIVPAGHIILNVPSDPETLPTTCTLPLQRCEDCHAQIKLTLYYGQHAESLPVHIQSNTPAQGTDIPYMRYRSRQSYSTSRSKRFEFSKYHLKQHQQVRTPRSRQVEESPIRLAQQEEETIPYSQLLKEHQEYWLEIVRLEASTDTLKQELNQLKNQLSQVKVQNQQLKEELKSEESQVPALLNQLQLKAQEKEQLEEQKDKLARRLAQLEEMFQGQAQVIKQSEEVVKHSAELLKAKEGALIHKDDIIRQLSQDIQKNSESLKQQQAAIQEKNSLQGQLLKKETQIAELFHQHQVQQKRIKHAQDQIKLLEQELELKSRLFLQEQTEKQSLILKASQQQTALQQVKSALEAQLQARHQECILLNNQKADLTQALVQARQERQQSKELLEECQAELIAVQQQLSQLKQHDYKSTYQRGMTELTLQQGRLEHQKQELIKQVQHLKTQNREKEQQYLKQLSQVKAFAHSKLQEIIQLRKDYSELELARKYNKFD